MIYGDVAQEVFYVYILLCADESYYTGLTNELMRRYSEHQFGEYPGCYTFNRRPLQLKYYETIPFLTDAIDREAQIKKWSRRKKKALIERNNHMLQLLSECNNLSHHKYKDLR